MITLDLIRNALLSPDPYTEMDRLVRTEMDTDRRVKDIFGDINPVVDEALCTPGLAEAGEEALWGTLDALTGNCRSDQCYYDPPSQPPVHAAPGEIPRWSAPQ